MFSYSALHDFQLRHSRLSQTPLPHSLNLFCVSCSLYLRPFVRSISLPLSATKCSKIYTVLYKYVPGGRMLADKQSKIKLRCPKNHKKTQNNSPNRKKDFSIIKLRTINFNFVMIGIIMKMAVIVLQQ